MKIFPVTKKDLRVDYFRCGGPGGQHVNKTATGVRITHLHTGLVSQCTETRSRGHNRALAFRRLADKLKELAEEKAKKSRVDGTSNELVRTYREVDDRVVDHATGTQASYKETVVNGDMDDMIDERSKAVLTDNRNDPIFSGRT